MFSTDLIESKQERVAINGVEPQMIGMLVSYAYTSEVYISKANVQVKPLSYPAPFPPLSIHLRGENLIWCDAGPARCSQSAGRDGRQRGLLSIHGASDGRDELCGDSLLC